MTGSNKKRSFLVVTIIAILFSNMFFIRPASADNFTLENLDINVFINADGSARIRENRKMEINEGTENYLIINNIGQSEIIDFVVSEDGRVYDYVNNWDINASREEKKFKNGIIETSSGYELSWGIGDYGEHEYIMEYTVTNMVKDLEDGQTLFWKFADENNNAPPANVSITIESEKPFVQGEEEIYLFGFIGGDIQFVDGKIIAKNDTPLDQGDYLTILVGFPEGMFATSDYMDMTFEEIKERAFEGSDYDLGTGDDGYYGDGYYDDGYDDGYNSGFGFFNLFPFLITIFIGLSIFSNKSSNTSPKKFKRKYKEEYYRDYPYEGDILDIYHILYRMGIGNFENLLTSFILKWINEEKIITETDESGFLIKKEQTNIRFLNKNMDRSSLEGQLFHMMLDAAGSNNILEEKEFTKWATRNRNKIESWEKKVKETSSMKLQDMGYLRMEEKKVLFFKTYDIQLTPKGEELEENIYKYINYLYDYSLLNEHEAINVKIWDNIMIWAAILGITEVVRKQFTKLYPRYETETVYRGNSIYLAHVLTRNIARAAAPPASTTRSGGGGGFSSGGGGGGSFGGGGGGVR